MHHAGIPVQAEFLLYAGGGVYLGRSLPWAEFTLGGVYLGARILPTGHPDKGPQEIPTER